MNEEGDNTVEITTIDWTDKDMKEKCNPQAPYLTVTEF